MTSISFCGKCNPRFAIDNSGKINRKGEMGFKMSCCGKCTNSECSDYGECDCHNRGLQQDIELLIKSVKDGTYPADLIDIEEF